MKPYPLFLDIEASSLTGWPIEIGLSQPGSIGIDTWSSLIRPRPDWSDADWAPEAERVHGIGRARLQSAPPADLVRKAVEARIQTVMISDCPAFDGKWLAMLLGRKVPLIDFDLAVIREFGASALALSRVSLDRIPHPHRAGPDAEAMAQVWLELSAAFPRVRAWF